MRVRSMLLMTILLAGPAVAAAQDKAEPLAPAGCTYTAYHAFTECKAASKGGGNVWWVVTDGLYACQGGRAPGRQRVKEDETALACDGKNKVKAPQPQEHYTVGLTGGNCQSPAKDGEVFIQQCISNIWHNVKYLRYRCLDGSIRLDAPRYYSTGKPCTEDGAPPPLDATNPGTETTPPTSGNTSLDLGDPAALAPSAPIARDSGTQMMIVDLIDLNVPGARAAVADADPLRWDVRGLLASAWHALTAARAPASASIARGIWLDPIAGHGGELQGVTRASRVHAYLTSLGTNQGEAFDIEIVNDGPTPVHLGGDGVVVQPIKKGAEKTVRAELQKVATRGTSVVTSRANAYCLDFKLSVPDKGMMFRVADPAAQQQYAPAREILRASRRLQAANQLQPDSDPAQYFPSIKQWTIWVNQEKFTQPQYRTAYVERIKKDVTTLGGKWTKQIEDALTSLTPHRWDEMAKILKAAGLPVPGA